MTAASQRPHQARKRFGQNFLQDPHIIQRILAAIHPGPGQSLLEIGPGQGALTHPLMAQAGSLSVIEVDRDLAESLRRHYADQPGFTLYQADVLKFDFSQLQAAPGTKWKVIGNLPYNISTPLLFRLLEHSVMIQEMVFMLQWEVVERLAAQPGDPHYGRLGIMVQYHCRVERLFKVPPGAFHPVPKVDSAIVKLTPWAQPPHPAQDLQTLALVVRTAFNQRRKTLRNCLKNLIDADSLAQLGIDPAARPERLSLSDYVKISNLINSK